MGAAEGLIVYILVGGAFALAYTLTQVLRIRRDLAREQPGVPQPALPPGAERLAALLPAAESHDESIRAMTMDRLVAFAGKYPEAVACLSRAAQRDPSVRVRMRAMSALNRLPELPPLAQSSLVVACQTDASPEVRAQAVRVLNQHQIKVLDE